MHVGLETIFNGRAADPAHVREAARHAEQGGFHSIWIPEHVVLFRDYASPYPYSDNNRVIIDPDEAPLEPLTGLAFLAACTSRIRLGTGITIVPQRNPVYTAKQVADVDVLSDGRVDFGIGVGWLAEEFRALDVPWEHRGARTDDYLQVMKALWTQEVSSFKGKYYTLPEVVQNPKPVQKPHPPIYVGGETDAALKRTARFGDGWFGVKYTPETLPAQLKKLDAALAREGRSRKDIKIAVSPYDKEADADMLKRFEDLGVDEVIVFAFITDREKLYRRIDELAEKLIQRKVAA